MNGSALTATASPLTAAAPARPVRVMLRSVLRDVTVIVGIWAVVALVSAGFSTLNRIHTGQPPEWQKAIALNLLSFELCTGSTLVLLWGVRRWPLGAGRWRYAPLYLGAIAVLVVIQFAIYLPLRVWLFPTPPGMIKQHLIESFFYEVFMMALVLGVVHAVEYQRSLREGQLRASQLENHLTRAKLEILRAELQPHFLFNALHSISTLMHRNVEAADEMLAQLGDLLRLSLERKNVQEAPLREELAVLAPYINILRIRFGDRLSIRVDVDPALLEVTVPLFILQPLVENAIRHGIDRRAGAGRIEIRARAEGESVEISVADDGAGLSQNGLREGIGLSNIRLRLEQLYGTRGAVALQGNPESGTQVTVKVPRSRTGEERG
ncbi:MAG TPA: histidine kinase [Myxococcales bacterium]|nr:histidine kinase [Myxococcales bacterium]